MRCHPFDILRKREAYRTVAGVAIEAAAAVGVPGAFYDGEGRACAPRWAVWLIAGAYQRLGPDKAARLLASLSEEQRAVLMGGGREVIERRPFPWWEELP